MTEGIFVDVAAVTITLVIKMADLRGCAQLGPQRRSGIKHDVQRIHAGAISRRFSVGSQRGKRSEQTMICEQPEFSPFR